MNQNPALTLDGTFYPDSIEVGCIFGMGKTLAPFAVGGYRTFDATIGVNDADPSPEVQQEIPCTVKILTGTKVLWQDTVKPSEVKHISFPLQGAARINIECNLNGPAKGYNVGRYPLGFGSAKIVR
ncbi:hypothetical protein [Amycolatopsis sp. Hca4]|uniref:hypothetical protein n=1 Tax=Amycolatopsis sp. Hca4 TaxID=2742131 RepID=UPI001591BD1C|nr:hypothetical protein [Amycolatopsis sp. Hca4]QKV74651.1 hypothetical protein HUT10_13360 [Amycolatopsis sp. Hca4]